MKLSGALAMVFSRNIIFIFIYLLLLGKIVTAQSLATKKTYYPTQFSNNQVSSFPDQNYVLVGHGTRAWDGSEASRDGILSLLQMAKRNSIVSIGFISEASQLHDEFYRAQDVSYLADSFSGTHRFSFPKTKVFFIGGGNLSYCLCELIRDTIIGSLNTNEKIKIVLVTDAIYDPVGHWPSQLGPRSVQLSPDQVAQPWFTPTFSLEDVVRADRPNVLVKYIKREIIGEKMRFCPNQNTFDSPDLDKSKFQFIIFDQSQNKIATVGNGKISIHFHFSKSTDIANYLP